MGLLKAEYDVIDHVTAFAAYGAYHSKNFYYGAQFPTLINAAGDVTLADADGYSFGFRNQTANAGIRAAFDTGPIAPRITLAADRSTGEVFGGGQQQFRSRIEHLRPGEVRPALSKGASRHRHEYKAAGEQCCLGGRHLPCGR